MSLINSLFYPDQGSPPTLGDKGKERYSLRIISDQMPDAGRQMWEIGVPKGVEFTSWKIGKWAQTKNVKKRELREMESQRKNDEER